MKSLRIVFLSVLLLFLVNMVWGQKSKKPKLPPSAIKTSAKISMKSEYSMYDSAVSILEEGVQYYTDDPEMHYLLGKAYSYKNNFRGMGEQFAIAESLKSDAKWMEDIKSLRTDKWIMVYNPGVDAYKKENYDTALVKFITCTIIDRYNYKGFLLTGYTYTAMKKSDEALSYMERATALAPDNPEAMKGYANVLFDSGKQKEALEIYNKVLEKDPKDANVLMNLINIYKYTKDFDQILVYSKKLIEIDPAFKNGYFNVGDIYLHQKYATTIRALDSLKDDSGEYPKDEKTAARIKDLTQSQADYLVEAQKAFESVVALDSIDLEAQVYLAEIYGEQNEFDKAVNILDALVIKDTTNCIAWQDIAVYCTKKGMTLKGEEASKIGEKAMQAWKKAEDCMNKPK